MICRTRLVAALAVAATSLPTSGTPARSVDRILEERIEEQIASQLESEMIDAIGRRVEDTVESTLLRGIEDAGDAAAGALGGVVEALPSPRERFVPEIDAAGHDIERGVWVLLVAPEQLAAVERLGLAVRERRVLAALNRVLLRVEAPRDRDLARAELELTDLAPGARIGSNHVYRGATSKSVERPARGVAGTPFAKPVRGLAIGIVDSAVASGHEALRGADIVQADFVSYARPRPTDHGTAIASVLVGESAALRARLRGARLYAASVFFEDRAGESAATTASLLRALDWLVASGVPVVNMSLAGPANPVLEAAIEAVSARGIVVVAAVGNAGPAGAPLYPAAYERVVGVTAVDVANRVYAYANRGPQVSFAAPGVEVAIARERGYGAASGTSYAAPHAAAILARALAARVETPDRVLAALKATAVDLGEPGFDVTFGHGLIVPLD